MRLYYRIALGILIHFVYTGAYSQIFSLAFEVESEKYIYENKQSESNSSGIILIDFSNQRGHIKDHNGQMTFEFEIINDSVNLIDFQCSLSILLPLHLTVLEQIIPIFISKYLGISVDHFETVNFCNKSIGTDCYYGLKIENHIENWNINDQLESKYISVVFTSAFDIIEKGHVNIKLNN